MNLINSIYNLMKLSMRSIWIFNKQIWSKCWYNVQFIGHVDWEREGEIDLERESERDWERLRKIEKGVERVLILSQNIRIIFWNFNF